MIKPATLRNVDLWEAWIEFDQLHPGYFGILYVMGEVEGGRKRINPFILHKVYENENNGILRLQFNSESLSEGRKPHEVVYSEAIRSIDQYSGIVVYAGNEEITRFDEIEILV